MKRELTNDGLAYVISPFFGQPVTLLSLRLIDDRLNDNFEGTFRSLIDRNGHLWVMDAKTQKIIAKPDL